MGKTFLSVTFFIAFTFCSVCQAQRQWKLEILPGISYVPPMPLQIRQEGHPAIKITARYRTEPLVLPVYYTIRLSTRKNDRGWSLELNHLKLYLDNKTREIERFSVTHGYNHIFMNRHWFGKNYTWIVGGGIVLGHPESTIRNLEWHEKGGFLNTGYYVSGFSAQGAVQFPLIETDHISVPLEAKITLGYGHVPIAKGHARVPIVSFNLLSGIGIKK